MIDRQGIAAIIVDAVIRPRKKEHGSVELFGKKAIKLYFDGAGLRRTGRQLGIHHQTVANWAKEESERLPKTPAPAEVKVAEFDKIITYITLVDRKTHCFLG